MHNPTATGLAADDELRDAQETFIERAAERRNEALKLKRSGMSYREVAAMLGISRQRAHHLVHRAIKENKPRK